MSVTVTQVVEALDGFNKSYLILIEKIKEVSKILYPLMGGFYTVMEKAPDGKEFPVQCCIPDPNEYLDTAFIRFSSGLTKNFMSVLVYLDNGTIGYNIETRFLKMTVAELEEVAKGKIQELVNSEEWQTYQRLRAKYKDLEEEPWFAYNCLRIQRIEGKENGL